MWRTWYIKILPSTWKYEILNNARNVLLMDFRTFWVWLEVCIMFYQVNLHDLWKRGLVLLWTHMLRGGIQQQHSISYQGRSALPQAVTTMMKTVFLIITDHAQTIVIHREKGHLKAGESKWLRNGTFHIEVHWLTNRYELKYTVNIEIVQIDDY